MEFALASTFKNGKEETEQAQLYTKGAKVKLCILQNHTLKKEQDKKSDKY